MTERQVFIKLTGDIQSDGIQEVKFLYPGNFDHKIYGRFNVTIDKLKKAVENFKAGVGTVLDEQGKKFLYTNFNHPSFKFNTDEGKAKSSGRIYDLFLKGQELFAKVWWTDKARELITKKEMNHISPEFMEEYSDEKGTNYGFTATGMALTPGPFLKYNQVAISLNENGDQIVVTLTEESNMEKKLREILGLKEDAEAAVIEQTVTELKEKAEASEKSLKETETKLTEAETKLKAVEKKLSEKPDDKKESSEIIALKETVEALTKLAQDGVEAKKTLAENAAKTKVEAHFKEGKFTAIQKPEMIKLAINSPASYDAIMKDAKPVIDLKESGDDGDGPDTSNPRIALHEAVKAKIAAEKKAGNTINYSGASQMVKIEHPELFEIKE